ncbi:MAG: hypothetical protein JRF33_18055 [Deltaproteobacteria bacterium]|nr:hypothetical protein [Deltaproteobacteria bacterium]
MNRPRPLLDVDLDAAMRKLAMGRMLNPQQLALTLVRSLVPRRPGKVFVNFGRSGIEVGHDGACFPADSLHRLRLLLDHKEPSGKRLDALDQIEKAGELDLLAAFASGARKVVLEAGLPVGLKLTREGGRLELERSSKTSGDAIVLWGLPGLDRAWSRRELTEHLRFARFEAFVDGRQVAGGLHLDEQIMQMSFRWGEIQGVLGLPKEGRALRIWRLVHGVLDELRWEKPIDGLICDVVIDAAGESEINESECISALMPDLLAQMRQRWAKFSARRQESLFRLLTRMMSEGADATEVLGEMPLFPRVDGSAASLQELKTASLGRIVRALDPEANLEDYDLFGEQVFSLDSLHRDFVQDYLGLIVREPMRRQSARGNLGVRLASHWTGFWHRLKSPFFGGKTIPKAHLEQDERDFIQALEDIYKLGLVPRRQGARVEMRNSRIGTWRWQMPGRLQLSRGHPKVRNLIKAWRQDPTSLYACLILFENGQDPFKEQRARALDQLLGFLSKS